MATDKAAIHSTMTTWIALLRGINVGGNNVIAMRELRALLAGLGLQNVRTYIQSGNCVFEHGDVDVGTLAESISDGIVDAFGFKPDVMILSRPELDAAIAGNPFPEGLDDPKSVHFYFLSEAASDPDLDGLRQVRSTHERFALSERVFYLYAPDGIGRSKLAAQTERKLGVPTTARNLRTAMKIAELAARPR